MGGLGVATALVLFVTGFLNTKVVREIAEFTKIKKSLRAISIVPFLLAVIGLLSPDWICPALILGAAVSYISVQKLAKFILVEKAVELRNLVEKV